MSFTVDRQYVWVSAAVIVSRRGYQEVGVISRKWVSAGMVLGRNMCVRGRGCKPAVGVSRSMCVRGRGRQPISAHVSVCLEGPIGYVSTITK